jgi:hypothetical protein
MTLPEGALIAGRYRVERQIGAGGMGSVYLASDTESGRAVALKQAHPGRCPADREAHVVRGLRHPRIVALYDSITAEGGTWLVMEYVPSRNLATIVTADGPLPAEQVAHLGRQLAEALQALHAKGVVHGDVSPGNVLVTDDGDAKLTDFGVARAIWSDATVTAGALVAGTPAYLAPEVARGGDRSPASDIFSLGATLFAAVEGVSPLGDAENPLTAVWRSASGHISAPTAGPLGSVLSRMLRAVPGERPDAAEVRRLLADPSTTPPRRSRVRTVVAAVAVGAAVLMGGGYALHRFVGTGSGGHAGRPDSFGDPHTADVCSLVQARALDRYGASRLVADVGGFHRCDVLVAAGGRDFADVKIELELGPPPEFDGRAQRQPRGSVTVVAEPPADQLCDRFVLLPDGNFAVVEAKLIQPGSLDLCAAASAEASYATAVLSHPPIPRRASRWPAASLANVDACGVIDAATLAKQPGFGRPAATAGFGRWKCEYDDETAPLSLAVRFTRNSTLTADDGQPTTLSGRRAFVDPEVDGPKTCLVSVVHRAYRNADGDAREEVVQVEVDGSRPNAELCSRATSLASVVAARLPAP